MTREEAIAIFKGFKFLPREMKAVEMAIKALEQEPCENAVSRQAVLNEKYLIELEDGQSFYCINPEDVEALPPVTPTRKHGEWEKEVFDLGVKIPVRVAYQCSECGNYFDSEFNFCPHCGADMRGENK